MSDIKQVSDITDERYEITPILVRCTRGVADELTAMAERRGISRNALILRLFARVIEGEHVRS